MLDSVTAATDLNVMLRDEARKLGLDAIGIARLDASGELAERLDYFLKHGRHGDMDWMEENADRRGDPNRLWPEAKSAIMIGQSYAPPDNPLDALAERDRGVISVYAKGRDYHDVVKKKIKSLARAFAAKSGADVKVFVDTAPLMEKPLAMKAGLGWQGKHTVLVSREHGDWLFLGAILTTAALAPDAEEVSRCGSCTRCLDICPTKAFPAPYQLDARRCLAYLSIEHKGHKVIFRWNFASRWAIAYSAATTASPSARGINLPPPRPRSASPHSPQPTTRRLPICWRSTMPRFANALRERR